MSTPAFPFAPFDIEQQRKRAKDLLRAARAGDVAAGHEAMLATLIATGADRLVDAAPT